MLEIQCRAQFDRYIIMIKYITMRCEPILATVFDVFPALFNCFKVVFCHICFLLIIHLSYILQWLRYEVFDIDLVIGISFFSHLNSYCNKQRLLLF